MAKTARKQITPTPTTIPMIRPTLFFLLLGPGGLLLTVGMKSIQVQIELQI
jgi:hypothetical protein